MSMACRLSGLFKKKSKKNRAPIKRAFCIQIPLILIFVCLSSLVVIGPDCDSEAGKAFIWTDKEGKIHFSGNMPVPEDVGGQVEERSFKEPSKEKLDPLPSRTPVEHSINCTFRLSNNRGGGSGFFINDRGLAITAKHVVEGITYSMKAELPGDDKRHSVRIVKRSRNHDLALIEVSIDRPTPFLELRDPGSLIRGETVFVIGNPLLAFKETVTSGNFSRLFLEKDFKKELKIKPPYKGDWVQFSAPIIGGNSGGPVVDNNGRLVGVVSLGLSSYGAINFAVPSWYISKEFESYL